ncbi:sugar phosphate isomerase/epimerase family protein [Vagococcus lutrae]|uniref:sugar phosphate isomerase/epimerase family protein n=1 Tax=Vagococcus lutrae TaxID=81947 RepID=UPI00200DBCDE|nr:sugar phosphate isomerase/epimerase family protein [Vagococcus lutrae]UQF12357.1 sugar phosphate isomerase/epimerase [Vagococcus lutrae]WEB80827.1 sugar phosphate isomerase/epimerase [Vagococcus lutrae]
MQLGINNWSLPSGLSLEETFRMVKQAGFDTIELNMSEFNDSDINSFGIATENSQFLTTLTTSEGLIKIKEISEMYDLPISSISTDLHWKYRLNDENPTVREQGKEVAKRMIDACHILGGDTVLIVPGVIKTEDCYEEAYRLAQQTLKELSFYAEKANIYLGVENVWNRFLLTPLEMKRFIDEINHPFIKVYLDIGNILHFGYPHQWIETLGSRIVKVHVKDYKLSAGNATGFTKLLAGDVNWIEVIGELKRVHYTGPLTAELTPNRYYPEQLVNDTAKALKLMLDK